MNPFAGISPFHSILRAWLLAAVLAAPVAAATYVVDPKVGSMTAPGGPDAPWSTLEAVFATPRTWRAGDVIVLRDGDHGRPTVSGMIAGGTVEIRAEAGHAPRLAALAFKGAANWIVTGLTLTPEGSPEPKRKPPALVSIAADCRDITVRGCEVYSARSIAGWTAADWRTRAVDGISSAGEHCAIEENVLRHVRFGIAIGRAGRRSSITRNRVEDFMSDGLRGLADECCFEGNVVKNCYAIDDNHDDGFQSWSGGADGVRIGGGVVRGVVLRGNVFISYTDPAQPFKAAMQGIGCFDGMFEDWVVENNLVVTDMWHGIAFYGAKNCRIVNNTVVKNPIDAAARTPWIHVVPHKRGTPSTGNLVRNNLAPTFHVSPTVGTSDHNLAMTAADRAAWFVDFAHFDFHLRAQSPAIDAGSDEQAPRLDLELHPRTAPCDIGAYEGAGGPAKR